MYLFFDAVSSRGYIALLDSDKNITASREFEIVGNESTQTIPIIHSFLETNSCSYQEIQNIICVVGPGSFTGIRTISLVVNTLAFIYPHMYLTPVNFFDLYNSYPIVKSSSKRDLFVKMSESDIIQLMSNEQFEKNCVSQEVYGDTNSERFDSDLNIVSHIDYEDIVSATEIKKHKTLAPLYIKKPNIS